MLKELLHAIGNLFQWFVIVTPWEQAIRVRAGKHLKLLGAGLFLRIPFIDRIYRQSIRRRVVTIHPQTITNADGKTITLGCCVGYTIGDLIKLYESLHDAEDTINAEIASQVAQFMVTSNEDNCRPEKLEEAMQGAMKLEQYGLLNPEFYVTNWVSVKTIRLLTGEIKWWGEGKALDTERHDGQHDSKDG